MENRSFRASDKHITCEEEFSDSEDEGEGGRRDRASFEPKVKKEDKKEGVPVSDTVDSEKWPALEDCCQLCSSFSKEGSTPLHLAVRRNHIECVKTLIDQGVDLNEADKEGRTALYLAAEAGLPDCVMTIFQHSSGFPILSIPTISGDTALHECMRHGEKMTECIKELVRRHADVSCRNEFNKSPLTLAVEYKWNMDIIELLILEGYTSCRKRGVGPDYLLGPLEKALVLRNDAEYEDDWSEEEEEDSLNPSSEQDSSEEEKDRLIPSTEQDSSEEEEEDSLNPSNGHDLSLGLYYKNVAVLCLRMGAADKYLEDYLLREMSRDSRGGCLFTTLMDSFAYLPYFHKRVEKNLCKVNSKQPEVAKNYRKFLRRRSKVPSLVHLSRIVIRSTLQADVQKVISFPVPKRVKEYILLGYQLPYDDQDKEGNPGGSSPENDRPEMVSSATG